MREEATVEEIRCDVCGELVADDDEAIFKILAPLGLSSSDAPSNFRAAVAQGFTIGVYHSTCK